MKMFQKFLPVLAVMLLTSCGGPEWHGTFEGSRDRIGYVMTVKSSSFEWHRRQPSDPRMDADCEGTFNGDPSGSAFRLRVSFTRCSLGNPSIAQYKTVIFRYSSGSWVIPDGLLASVTLYRTPSTF